MRLTMIPIGLDPRNIRTVFKMQYLNEYPSELRSDWTKMKLRNCPAR